MGIRIFLADSSEEQLLALQETIGRWPECRLAGCAVSGEEALEAITRLQPDLLITDLPLRGLDGIGLMEHLTGMRIRIIVLSGFISDTSARRISLLGADDLLLKPCAPQVLRQRITDAFSDAPVSVDDKRQTALDYRIGALLHELGMPAHLKGYQFVRFAVAEIVENRCPVTGLMHHLYPHVARRFNTSGRNVERNIRNAIDEAWLRGDPEVLARYFSYTVSTERGKPTNGEFLALIAGHIRSTREIRRGTFRDVSAAGDDPERSGQE